MSISYTACIMQQFPKFLVLARFVNCFEIMNVPLFTFGKVSIIVLHGSQIARKET